MSEITYFDVIALVEELREENKKLGARIAELEAHNADLGAFVDQLIKAGNALTSVAEWRWSALSELFAWDALVKKRNEVKNERN